MNKSSEIQDDVGGRGVLEPVLSVAKKFLGQDPLFIFLFGGAKRKKEKRNVLVYSIDPDQPRTYFGIN